MLNIASKTSPVLLSILCLTFALASQAAETAPTGKQTAPAAITKSTPESVNPVPAKKALAPVPDNMKQWLEGGNFKLMVLIDADGKTRLLDNHGKEVESCGVVKGNQIPPSCKTQGMTKIPSNASNLSSLSSPVNTPSKTAPMLGFGSCPNGSAPIWISIFGCYYRYCP